jgi:hypothetical protein
LQSLFSDDQALGGRAACLARWSLRYVTRGCGAQHASIDISSHGFCSHGEKRIALIHGKLRVSQSASPENHNDQMQKIANIQKQFTKSKDAEYFRYK